MKILIQGHLGALSFNEFGVDCFQWTGARTLEDEAALKGVIWLHDADPLEDSEVEVELLAQDHGREEDFVHFVCGGWLSQVLVRALVVFCDGGSRVRI